jgi:hypothetical protein
MQVASDKAAAILAVGDGVSSVIAGAEIIGVVRVSAEVGIATAEEIGRAGSIVKVFGRFKARVRSSDKS